AEVREVTPPATFDPADHYRRVRSLGQDVPYSLAEVAQGLLDLAPHVAFWKQDDALAPIQGRDRLLQLWGLVAISRLLTTNGMDHVNHQESQDGQVVEDARHHRRELPGQDLGQPQRIEPGAVVGDHQARPAPRKGLQAGAVTTDAVD